MEPADQKLAAGCPMREAFSRWVADYPKAPGWRDGTFTGSPVAQFVKEALPEAVTEAIPANPQRYKVEASAGLGDWTHTPWVAVMDRAITTSVEEGYYIVYLLSHGCDRLYLTLNQGCTSLRDEVGDRQAREVLTRRAAVMRQRLSKEARGLRELRPMLRTTSWRGRLYEVGTVLGVEYDPAALPSEEQLVADLHEALRLYRLLAETGGWEAEDEIKRRAEEEGFHGTLVQQKRYRQHRTIERLSYHSEKVKKALGWRCMGCDLLLADRYGPAADNLIEAHHLVPLSQLADGQVVEFDPKRDFAVLCPNCHAVIHRLDDPSDLKRLRSLVRGSPPS